MKTFTYLLFIGIFFSNCSIYKPDSGLLSEPDYNQRVNVSNAHYDKVLTPVGVSSFFVGTAAGAYLGYISTENSNYFAEYNGTQKQNFSIAGGVVGAFTGYTLTYLLNKAVGWGDYKSPANPDEWIKKANKNFLLVRQNDNSNFMVIHNSAENKYIVKNLQDAKDFSIAFTSQSSYANNVCQQTINNYGIYREDYLELMNLFPTNSSLLDMKKRYVWLSPSVATLYSSFDRFPETNINIEQKSSDMITCFSEAKLFNGRFPTSLYNKKVIISALDNSTIQEISLMPNMFKRDFELIESDFNRYQTTNKGKRNFLNAQFLIRPPSSVWDVEYIYNKYTWLKYTEKPDDILNNYWDVGYRTFSDGNQLVAFMNQLPRKWNISTSLANTFIQNKLSLEIQNHVSWRISGKLGNNNTQWEQWLNNTEYTAGIVKDQSEIDFVVYGTITNNSKFDLPIRIDVNANLYAKRTLQGTGFGTNLALFLFEEATQQNLHESYSQVGNASQPYFIPNLRRGSNVMYAVVLDYGDTKRFGLNLGDLYKYTEEIMIDEVNLALAYNTNTITNEIITRQNSWQYFAKNGIPNARLIDAWRNVEYDDNAWREDWARIQEEKRRAAERALQEENNRRGEASSLVNANFTWDWDGEWSGGGSFLWADFPYNREFIIKKDGEEWARGNIEKAQKSNSFNVQFEITDYNTTLSGREMTQYYYWVEDDKELYADDGWFIDTKVSDEVHSFGTAISYALDFTKNQFLQRIIEYGN